MKPYVVKTPSFVQRLYPKRLWSFPRDTNNVYLTFDDGPIPEVTPWVLDQLKNSGAKATFFCIGHNVAKHPEIFRRIIAEGHTVGNHTYNHFKGWKTSTEDYVENVMKAEEVIRAELEARSTPAFAKASSGKKSEVRSGDPLEIYENPNRKPAPSAVEGSSILNLPRAQSRGRKLLFRPPYGKITKRQAEALQNKGYKIVMWDVISADFDTDISEEKCLENVLGAITPGSIVVFHDSLKASKNLMYTLPKVLDFISEKGWKCEAIEG